MTYEIFLYRIIICFILGCIIGLERQYRHKMIGLRTYVLVSLGAFLFVSISVNLNDDLTRVAAQVVSGIGFLGAGVILRDGVKIRGLNTAATLWCSAAIGVICAFGFVFEALVGTLLILLSNILLRIISKFINNKIDKNQQLTYKIKVICSEEKEMYIRTLLIQKLNSSGLIITDLEQFEIEDNKTKLIVNVDSSTDLTTKIEKIISALSIESGVTKINFTKEELIEKEEDNDE